MGKCGWSEEAKRFYMCRIHWKWNRSIESVHTHSTSIHGCDSSGVDWSIRWSLVTLLLLHIEREWELYHWSSVVTNVNDAVDICYIAGERNARLCFYMEIAFLWNIVSSLLAEWRSLSLPIFSYDVRRTLVEQLPAEMQMQNYTHTRSSSWVWVKDELHVILLCESNTRVLLEMCSSKIVRVLIFLLK